MRIKWLTKVLQRYCHTNAENARLLYLMFGPIMNVNKKGEHFLLSYLSPRPLELEI